jgi:hypothetical protein
VEKLKTTFGMQFRRGCKTHSIHLDGKRAEDPLPTPGNLY